MPSMEWIEMGGRVISWCEHDGEFPKSVSMVPPRAKKFRKIPKTQVKESARGSE